MTQETCERRSSAPERSAWTGWIVFAGVMMIISGTLDTIFGLIGIVKDEWIVWSNSASVYLDVSQWGWVHLTVGLVVLLVGCGIFTGHVLARTVGVIVAIISLIVNFLYIPAYALWTLTVIAMNVLVIWALTAHGSEMREF